MNLDVNILNNATNNMYIFIVIGVFDVNLPLINIVKQRKT